MLSRKYWSIKSNIKLDQPATIIRPRHEESQTKLKFPLPVRKSGRALIRIDRK